jgi:hypothetical protein
LKLADDDSSELSMLERISRFVLEVLPYALSALIAAVVVPGFLYSQVPGTKAAVAASAGGRGEYVLGIIREDHAAFTPEAVRPTTSPSGVSLRSGVRTR